jgi:hypothetical protein
MRSKKRTLLYIDGWWYGNKRLSHVLILLSLINFKVSRLLGSTFFL